MSDDRRIKAEYRVAAGVIAVPVRVDDEFELALAQFLKRGLDLVGERRVLIINDQKAVRADRNADVSTRAFKHIDVAGHLGRFHLNFGKILPLGESHAGGEEQSE